MLSIFALALSFGGAGGPAQAEPGARPEPKAMAVLPVLEGGGRAAEVFAAADRAGVLRPVRVMSADSHLFEDGEELSAQAARCGDDPRCLADALAAFRADLGLVVITSPVDPPLLGVLLVDTARREVISDRYEDLRAQDLEDQVARLAGVLLDAAGLERFAELEVVLQPPTAGLTLDGVPAGTGSRSLLLTPGQYRLEARANGHQKRVEHIELRGGERSHLEMALEPDRPLWASPWVWIGVGVLAAGAAVGAGAAAASETGRSECACVSNPSGTRCITCP